MKIPVDLLSKTGQTAYKISNKKGNEFRKSNINCECKLFGRQIFRNSI